MMLMDRAGPLSCGVLGVPMPVDIHDFVRALTSYPAFEGVSPEQRARALQEPEIELSVDFVEAAVDPLVRPRGGARIHQAWHGGPVAVPIFGA